MKSVLQDRLIAEYDDKIRRCTDPMWKRVLILDKREISSSLFVDTIHNYDHIVEVCGSDDAVIKYLESCAEIA